MRYLKSNVTEPVESASTAPIFSGVSINAIFTVQDTRIYALRKYCFCQPILTRNHNILLRFLIDKHYVVGIYSPPLNTQRQIKRNGSTLSQAKLYKRPES